MPNSWGWTWSSSKGWIYILDLGNGLYKVGRTIHLAKRLQEHRREYRKPEIDYVAIKEVSNCLTAERRWHRAFSDKRVSLSEHFALTDEDIDVFDQED